MTKLRKLFIRDLEIRGLAARTVQCYVAYLADLARYYHRCPSTLSESEICDWLHHLKSERKLSPSSVNLAVCAVRSLLGGTLNRDTTALRRAIPRSRTPTQVPRVYSAQDVEQLILHGCTNPKQRAFLILVYGSGLRLSEACQIQVTDIDARRLQILVRFGKGNKERVVQVSQTLLLELRRYWPTLPIAARANPRWLFPSIEDPARPMSKGTGQLYFTRAIAKAGLNNKGGIHTLRHTFATHLLENGVDITVVARQLGHASIMTTARYLHVRQERLAELRNPLNLIASLLKPQPPTR